MTLLDVQRAMEGLVNGQTRGPFHLADNATDKSCRVAFANTHSINCNTSEYFNALMWALTDNTNLLIPKVI